MKIFPVEGNSQRLDGGAMFGNAPQALWKRWVSPDALNRIPLACRGMLIQEDSGRTILCDTGIGNFFPPSLKERFGVVEEEAILPQSIAKAGYRTDQVDVIVLSHLHFDHVGGLLSPYEEGKSPSLLFPRARYVISRPAWERAQHPHARDRASFIAELPALLEKTQLEIIEVEDNGMGLSQVSSKILGPRYKLHVSFGHTPGLLLLEAPLDHGPMVFASDLIPGKAWVHLPITMGYDRFPERLINEKQELYEHLLPLGGKLFFTHDHAHVSATLHLENGRFSPVDPLPKATS